jgi:hypothetical protein
VDDEQTEKLERERLELARSKLSQEQRARLESHAERLREENIYLPRHEISIAEIIYEDRSRHHQRSDIESVYTRATNDARDRELREQQDARLMEFREAEARKQQAKQEAALEQQRQREAQSRDREQRETQARERQQREAEARKEPIPGSIKRFNEHLGRQPDNDKRPLTANEVQGRFGDAGLEARYRREQQERNPRDYGELNRPLTAQDQVARGNTPGEKIIETPAARVKFIREAGGEKFTRESREGKSGRPPRGRDGGRERDDGRDR